jgi:transposase
MNNEALAVVAGVSAENGLEAYLIEKGSINSQSFVAFLRQLVDQNPQTPLAIFMDNASFHRSGIVT